MTLNDDATLVIDSGNYFRAPVGTALPEDLLAPDVAWINLGHTPLEDIFSVTSEGGEATIIGTLQKKTLRTRYSTRTDTINVTLQQLDEDSLKLYYGSNAVTTADGLIGVPETGKPTDSAYLAIYVDGDNVFAIYAPKAEIFRADDISAGDTETLVGLPIGIKPIKYQTNAYTYAVTPLGDTTP